MCFRNDSGMANAPLLPLLPLFCPCFSFKMTFAPDHVFWAQSLHPFKRVGSFLGPVYEEVFCLNSKAEAQIP